MKSDQVKLLVGGYNQAKMERILQSEIFPDTLLRPPVGRSEKDSIKNRYDQDDAWHLPSCFMEL